MRAGTEVSLIQPRFGQLVVMPLIIQRETRELIEVAFTSLCRPFRHLMTLIPTAELQTITNSVYVVAVSCRATWSCAYRTVPRSNTG